ncbi:MAG: hypothetical protein IKE76_01285 [Clostridia bacterium]|nr:hypothetical protein [Clostridia bacterium]
MVKLINAVTGSEMWVHEARLDEYLEAGHKLAPPPPPPPRKPRSKTSSK